MPSAIKLFQSECPLPQAPESAGWESESSLDHVLMGIDTICDCPSSPSTGRSLGRGVLPFLSSQELALDTRQNRFLKIIVKEMKIELSP